MISLLPGEISSVARDVQAIYDSHPLTGLLLNACKCEITAKNFDIIDEFAIFKDFRRIAMEDLTLLEAPILGGSAVDNGLQDKIATLERSIIRLSKLQSHDALCLLRNSLSMPKLHHHAPATFYCASSTGYSELGSKAFSTSSFPMNSRNKHHCRST